jgi:MSHA biogenesis protein MshI
MSIASAFKARARVLTSSGGLGIAPADGGVRVAVVRRVIEGLPQVLACHAFDGPQAFAALSQWRRKAGWQSTQANLLLETGDYQILPLEVPDVPAAELASVARWKIKDLIDYPPEEASVACVLVPGDAGPGRPRHALVVAAPRKAVVQWMGRSREAKLALHAIDVPELALRNLAALIPGAAACGLLHVGLARTTLVMVWQGELCSFRRFELTLGQLINATADEREAIIERMALDLQRTSDAFERQFYAAALGPMRVIEEVEGLPLAELLSRYVSSRVLSLKLREYLDVQPSGPLIDAATGIDYVPAIGAALRDEDGA